MNPVSSALPMIGARVSRLRVVGKFKGPNGTMCRVVCDCGGELDCLAQGLRRGRPRSCGCLTRAENSARRVRHGRTGTPEYRAWKGAIFRCSNPSAIGFHVYGGRGIRVCDRWSGNGGFENFLADMGPKPSPRHSLDRLDNNKGYEPGNCRWATGRQQNANRRVSIIHEIDGVAMTLREWSYATGVDYSLLRARIKMGWELRRAISSPRVIDRRSQR